MKQIKYVKGDATQPEGSGIKYIIHCCNDIGGWGSGFVVALSKRWSKPEQNYRHWHKEKQWWGAPFELGQVQFVNVGDNCIVVNMIGQHGTVGSDEVEVELDENKKPLPPIRYDAIGECLDLVRISVLKIKTTGITVHCPRFGSGLAGGEWEKIEQLLIDRLAAHDVQVTVYDL